MESMEAVKVGVVATLAIGGGFWAAGKYLPGMIVSKIRKVFDEAKTSPWWREPAKPHRARFLLAAFTLLEAEVPDPGEGQEVYAAFGAWANGHARLGGVPIGSADQWAAVARKGGDAIDTELDAEVAELAKLIAPETPAA